MADQQSDRPQLRDAYSVTQAESDALIAIYQTNGGDLSLLDAGPDGELDMVSAIAALGLRPPTTGRSLPDVAAEVNVDVQLARRLWSNFGFDPGAADLDDADADALTTLGGTAFLVGTDGALEMSRVAGMAARSLAFAVASLMRVGFEIPQQGAPRDELAVNYYGLITAEVPRLLDLFETAFRRQLVAAAENAWQPDETHSVVTTELAIGFADLVGFTEWSAQVSASELAQTLDRFESGMWNIAASTGVEIVKFIGDEVMFVAPTVDQAVTAAVRLIEAVKRLQGMAAVRAAVSAGEVISRTGDVFGTVVNEAARLVAAAEPGEILVADRAHGAPSSFGFGTPRAVPAKGFSEPITVHPVTRP